MKKILKKAKDNAVQGETSTNVGVSIAALTVIANVLVANDKTVVAGTILQDNIVLVNTIATGIFSYLTFIVKKW